MAANSQDRNLVERLMALRMAYANGSKEELLKQIAMDFSDLEIEQLIKSNSLTDLPNDYEPIKYRR